MLLQVGLHAASVGFTSAILAPGVEQVAESINVSVNKALLTLSVPLAFLSVAPFLWALLADAYGRRPVLIGCMLLESMACLGGGYANSFGTLVTARAFQMCGGSAGLVMGSAVVVDIFWQRERGRKIGIWTQTVILGPAIGGLVGGPLIQAKGWRWAQWLGAITCAAQLIAYLLTFEETLYGARKQQPQQHSRQWSIARIFQVPRRVPGSSLSILTAVKPLYFLQSPVVVICALAYAVCFSVVSVGVATIIPLPFGEYYNFNSTADGLTYIAILVGVIIGEQAAGPLSDRMMKRHIETAKAGGHSARLEHRLRALPLGYVLVVVGLIMFGESLEQRNHWIVPCIGMGIASGALQIVATVLTTYCVDVLSADALSVSVFINFVRQAIAFTILFWSPPLCDQLGYGAGFIVEAAVVVAFFLPTGFVYWRGDALRKRWPVRGLRS